MQNPELPLRVRDPLQWASTVLENQFRPKGIVDYDAITKAAKMERKDCDKHLQAAAAVTVSNQVSVRNNLCKWVQQQSQAGAMKPLLYMEHVCYDETPMKLNVHWGTNKQCATTKILVIDTEYLMLMQLQQPLVEPKDMPKNRDSANQFLCVRGRRVFGQSALRRLRGRE